jgi:hypothetical protein
VLGLYARDHERDRDLHRREDGQQQQLRATTSEAGEERSQADEHGAERDQPKEGEGGGVIGLDDVVEPHPRGQRDDPDGARHDARGPGGGPDLCPKAGVELGVWRSRHRS